MVNDSRSDDLYGVELSCVGPLSRCLLFRPLLISSITTIIIITSIIILIIILYSSITTAPIVVIRVERLTIATDWLPPRSSPFLPLINHLLTYPAHQTFSLGCFSPCSVFVHILCCQSDLQRWSSLIASHLTMSRVS